MKEKRKGYLHKYWRIGSLITFLIVIVFGVLGGLFFGVPGMTPGLASQQTASKPIDITVYVTTETLAEIFQSRVNQTLDGAVTGSVSHLPAQNRTQILQMANALLQPSASLTSIVPQQDSLITDVQLSLYPDDPHPINAQMQISFHVLSSSTMQVSVEPLPGSPVLASGPVSSIQMPLGQLNSVVTTPSCGSTALAIHLQFPLALSSSNASSQPSTMATAEASSASSQAQNALNLAVDIPPSSLDAIGQSVGSMPISSMMSASNIHLVAQNGVLNITSDLYMDSLNVGSSKTTVSTTAENGNLTMHVINTTVQLFHEIPFPYNMYNQQLETTLNTKLQTAFAGKLAISQATLGSNAQVSCAPQNGLLLTGAANLGSNA